MGPFHPPSNQPYTVRRHVRCYTVLDEQGDPSCKIDTDRVVVLHPATGCIDHIDRAQRVFACGADPHEHRAVAQCADCHRSICAGCTCAGPSCDGFFRCDACSREIIDREGRTQRLGHDAFHSWRSLQILRSIGRAVLAPFVEDDR